MDDAPIEIAEYDPTWVEAFQFERTVLCDALAPWLVGVPEHIGSTAVPGLAAKPIIDIMAPVLSLEDSRAAIAAAVGAGYVYFPYRAEAMHWFCKPSPSVRTHHLHLVPMGSRLWNERLAFRDALRADENLRAEYRDLKLALADSYRHDRDGYTDAKAPFIHRVLESALKGGVTRMDIRALTPSDAAAFQALRLRGLKECPEAFASSYEEEVDTPLVEIEKRLQPRVDAAVFGAFNGSELLALVGLQREAMKKLAHKSFIWGVYVAPEARRTGVGTQVMLHALRHATAVFGARQVNLGVNARNSAAVALYAKLGFVEYGLERGYLLVDGVLHDECQMVCFVASAA